MIKKEWTIGTVCVFAALPITVLASSIYLNLANVFPGSLISISAIKASRGNMDQDPKGQNQPFSIEPNQMVRLRFSTTDNKTDVKFTISEDHVNNTACRLEVKRYFHYSFYHQTFLKDAVEIINGTQAACRRLLISEKSKDTDGSHTFSYVLQAG